MADLGDLTDFIKEGSSGVSDLDWLDVDEAKYRREDTLPKQNLDIAPDLIALWSHEDQSPSTLVPNKGEPKTMGDLSSIHGKLRTMPEDLIRTARLAMMQSTDPKKISHALSSRYDSEALTVAKTALATVFAERGLLGKLYITASDFPDCNKGGKVASEFVRRFAQEAPFVVAKTACSDCTHRQITANGSSHCGVFHKELQVEVPYTSELASTVEKQQASRGKAIQASTGTSPKDRIRQAFLGEALTAQPAFTGRPQAPQAVFTQGDSAQQLIAVANLTKKRDVEGQQKLAAAKARPIIALLSREMLKGHGEAELVRAMRLAFDMTLLEETKAEWVPLFKEAGLYGAVYSNQTSFDDCREGADFVNKHGSKIRAIVAGDKCSSCIFNKAGRCMMYGRQLVASVDAILNPQTVSAVLDEHRIAGKLPHDAAKYSWGSTPAEALKAIHKAASAPIASSGPSVRSSIEKAFYGHTRAANTNELTKREILKTASKYMNEGLYGEDLLSVLKSRFDVRDLTATAGELKVVLAEQGLQGIKYIDPTAYDDYGKGCHTAASAHRSRAAVQYLKVGDKCASCVHQTRVGFCSVINKQLVVEPPYIDKLAEQRAILASGNSTTVSYESLMNNGLNMMQEYQLQHDEVGAFDLNPEVVVASDVIEFGTQKVRL
jgi:hypothetical protein